LSSISQFYVWGMFPHCPILDPEALAPARLCCPSHQHLATSSASLTVAIPFPATGGYRFGLWHSRIILPDCQTFRAFTAELSRIAAFNFRREPDSCSPQFLQSRHWSSNRSGKLLTLHQYPFRRLVRSLSLRPSCLRASSSRVTPTTARYNYGVTLGPTPAGLSPASSAAILAAPDPRGFPRHKR